MPADMLSDNYGRAGGLRDDKRVMMLTAAELSRLGLNLDDGERDVSGGGGGIVSRLSDSSISGGGGGSSSSFSLPGMNVFEDGGAGEVATATANDYLVLRKSANMTECVPVPSSEHVAEIVGRQGCKIKALRAKTNTYIKTPVRGDEPVFVVTGRKEDVASAKREILSAAEHFSQIRASRRNLPGNSIIGGGGSSSRGALDGSSSTVGAATAVAGSSGGGGGVGNGTTATAGGGGVQVTQEIRVPFRVVGLVVGPKGATIKRIQQETQTYIVTPSRDKDPVFEIIGTAENVEKARKEIESYINLRTKGGLAQTTTTSSTTSLNNNNNTWRTFNECNQNKSADLLSLFLQNPIENSNMLTSYKNILNLGLGQLRGQRGGVCGSSEVGRGRPFSLNAAELFDQGSVADDGGNHSISVKWRSYDCEDGIGTCLNHHRQLLLDEASPQYWPDHQKTMVPSSLQGLSSVLPLQDIIRPGDRGCGNWSHDSLFQGAPTEKPSSSSSSSSSCVTDLLYAQEAILGMCVTSLYSDSLLNSSDLVLQAPPPLVGSVMSLRVSSGSVSDSSSASPTDFGQQNSKGIGYNNDRKFCVAAKDTGSLVDSVQRCSICH